MTLPTGHTIRPFDYSDGDYATAVALENAVFPEYPSTVAEWRHWEASREAKCHHERHLVFAPDGTAVASASASHNAWTFHPRRLSLGISVHPDHRQKSLGAALYAHLRESIARFDPIGLRGDAREDQPVSRAFLEHRGFAEVQRDWENHLDLSTYDDAPFAGRVERVVEGGIRIATFRELEAEDPDVWRNLYEMHEEIARDVPSPDPHTAIDHDTWVKRVRDNPNLMPDGYFLALDGGRYVGVSNLWRSQADDTFIETGLTGVRRTHRRRGIALALKLRALDYARGQGFRKVKTWNERGNEGMLAINEALGFKKQPAWITYALELQPDPDAPAAGGGAAGVERAATA